MVLGRAEVEQVAEVSGPEDRAARDQEPEDLWWPERLAAALVAVWDQDWDRDPADQAAVQAAGHRRLARGPDLAVTAVVAVTAERL